MSATAEEVGAALERVLTMLAADGYDGHIETLDRRLLFEINARDGACADCLTSKEVMKRLVESALDGAGLDFYVDLRYPTDPR